MSSNNLFSPWMRNFVALTLVTGHMSGHADVTIDGHEPDDQPAAARVIAPQAVQTHTIHVDGDVDWLKVTPTAGNYYQVEARIMGGSNPDVAIELFDASGKLLAYDDDRGLALGARLAWRAEGDEVYFLKVRAPLGPYARFDDSPGGAADCTYELSLVETVNTPPEIVGPIVAPAQAQTGTASLASFLAIDPDGDELRYGFDWGDGTREWGSSSRRQHVWTESGGYCLRVRARDTKGASSAWSPCVNVSVSESAVVSDTRIEAVYCALDNDQFTIRALDVDDSGNDVTLSTAENPHGNAEKPWLIALSNGQRGILHTAQIDDDPARSVLFRILGTTTESAIFQHRETAPGTFYQTMYARGIQRADGSLIAAFARANLAHTVDRSRPATTVLHVYGSNDLGRTWSQRSIVRSAESDYPDWSGLWQPTPFELSSRTLALVATEQRFWGDQICERLGRTAYRTDTLVMFKSFDGGITWPWKRRIYGGECGIHHNEPSIARLPDGRLMIVFSQAPSGNLLASVSGDGGQTWSVPELVAAGSADYENRYPRLMLVDGRPTVLHRKERKRGSNLDDLFGVVQQQANGAWLSKPDHLPAPDDMMCKIE